MNKIANKQVICDVLMRRAQNDRELVVLCSDSRGSASLGPFAEAFADQFVEIGIAEQDLVGVAAGMASCGKRPYAVSPASFLSARSYEQIKVDVAYSGTNVKLIGVSGGVSYGALGMSHHSLQDIAAISAIPGMRVYLPSDRFQTEKLMEQLLTDDKGAYIRVGRGPVEDIYSADDTSFQMDRATRHGEGRDVLLVACGEMVKPTLDAAALLKERGIEATVLDMYCVKPLDQQSILDAAQHTRLVVTVEEHSPYGGLGSMVCQALAGACPQKAVTLSMPDTPVITGDSKEVFDYYGLNAEGIAHTVIQNL